MVDAGLMVDAGEVTQTSPRWPVTALGCMAGLGSMSFDADSHVTAENQGDEQEKQHLGPCRDASTVDAIDLGRSKVPSAAGAVP